MLNLILIAHGILILLLASWAFSSSRFLKVPITIHNIPIIILTGLGLCIAAWWARFNPEYFIPTGILFGFVVFIINSVKIPNFPNPTIFRKICMSLLCVLFWSEIIVLLWVATIHVKKINEKPEH